jgi:hypothetical protein
LIFTTRSTGAADRPAARARRPAPAVAAFARVVVARFVLVDVAAGPAVGVTLGAGRLAAARTVAAVLAPPPRPALGGVALGRG